jgi:two-component system sensor histidine kinase/response regulator
LLDVMMPGMDGFETCRQIKSNPELVDIPVIFLTAKSDADSLAYGFSQGAVDYISKPFSSKELISRVQSHIELYRARKELHETAQELQKRATLLQKANQTRDLLFGIIAHDLRGPLGVSLNMLQVLTLGKECSALSADDEMLVLARDQSERCMNLLNELLAWAMSETSDIEARKSEVDLGDLIADCVALFSPLAARKQVDIRIQNNGAKTVFVDREMISTVVRNIISNGIKFSPKMNPIDVVLERFNEEIVCSVSDHGVGIPNDKLASIFEISRNKSTQGTMGEGGTGLGLFLCRWFVEKNGGRISIESQPEKGTIVKISIPCVKSI